MVKQKVHVRKIGTKNYIAGKGKRDILIGKLVWYKRKVYQVKSKNKQGRYTLVNLTAKLMVTNVPRLKIRMYK